MIKGYVLDKLSKLLIKLIERPRYRSTDFSLFHSSSYVDTDVYISDPQNVHLEQNTVICRGTKIFCSRGRFELGADSHLAGDVYVNASMGSIKIGTGTAVGPKTVLVSHSNHYTRDKPITKTYKTGDICIGDDVFIGAGVIILPGITIADHAVIGAGAVVTKDVGSGVVVGGIPGAIIGQRRNGND